jgi:hypothetical protein
MMRRTGFKRKAPERVRSMPTPVPEHLRRNASMGPAEIRPAPLQRTPRNPAYLAMAAGQPCQMRRALGCLGSDGSTTVAAHSNLLEHGKGRGLKASDAAVVYACVACHSWLDGGPAPADEKHAAFAAGLMRQRALLTSIVESMTTRPAHREAAAWALEHMPVVSP